MNKAITALLSLAFACASVSAHAIATGDAAAGKEKAATCAACHGADGNSTDPQYPRLAGQYADYLRQALADYKSGARSNPLMAGFAAGLSEQDQKDLAAFFSQQTGLSTPALKRGVNQ